MTRGIKIQDVTVGTGDEALRGKTVVANVRMFLNHGTELTGTFLGGQKMRIDYESASVSQVCNMASRACESAA